MTIYGLFFARHGEDVAGPVRPLTWAHPLGIMELFRSRRTAPLRLADGRGVRIEAEDTLRGGGGVYLGAARVVPLRCAAGADFLSVRAFLGERAPDGGPGIFCLPASRRAAASGRRCSRAATRARRFRSKPGDDFAGVRAYVPGESLRHVDWKAFARGRPLSVKQFTGGGGYELWLDAAEMGRLPLEARLSQLALWVVNAEKEEIPYALKLGRTTLPLGLGAGPDAARARGAGRGGSGDELRWAPMGRIAGVSRSLVGALPLSSVLERV